MLERGLLRVQAELVKRDCFSRLAFFFTPTSLHLGPKRSCRGASSSVGGKNSSILSQMSEGNKSSVPVRKSVQGEFPKEAGWMYPPSLFPLPEPPWPPRVEHLLVVQEGSTIVDELAQQLGVPRSLAEELTRFGAVHYAPVMPPPPDTSKPSVQLRWTESIAKASEELNLSSSSQALKLLMRVERLQDPDQVLRKGGYLRVHVHPKRFPRCYKIAWKDRVLAETPDYIVLDKPAGIPVQGTVDNLKENCAACLSETLALDEPLKVTHRLDVGTEGCLVLAKSPSFLRTFNQLLASRRVHKTYRALTFSRPPLGCLQHYTLPKSFAPRILSDEPRDGWLSCELEILAVEEVRWPTEAIRLLGVETGGWPLQDKAYDCTIRLMTGRTHQIRAQLSRMGCPLVGDTMYMPEAAIAVWRASDPSTSLDQICTKLGSRIAMLHCSLEDKRWYGADSGGPLVLQAWKLTWDGSTEEYVARTPWWHDVSGSSVSANRSCI